MISTISAANPIAGAKIYADAANMSMKNSYSVMEKTLEATEQETAKKSDSVTYQIDINNRPTVPEHYSAGALVDTFA
jgi:hypothetical protein